jgi:phage terminase small subunit
MASKEQIKAAYEAGEGSIKVLADKYGVKANTIKSWKSRDATRGCEWIKKGATKSKKVATKKEKYAVKKIVEEMKEDGIKESWKDFVVYYVQSFDATQSAIKAGYSPRSAHVEGCRLLKNDNVKKYIDEIRAMQLEGLLLNGNDILQRHAKVAYSNIFDFVDENKKLKPIEEIDGTLIKDFSYSTLDKEDEFGVTKKTDIKLKVEDRKPSLDFLTKFMKLDPGKTLNVNHTYDDYSDEDLDKELQELEDD